jgi:hypothetical protein
MQALSWKRALIACIHRRSSAGSALPAVLVAPALRTPKSRKSTRLSFSRNTPMAAQPSSSIIYMGVMSLYSEGWAEALRLSIKSHISSKTGHSSRRLRYWSAGAGTRRAEQHQHRGTPYVSISSTHDSFQRVWRSYTRLQDFHLPDLFLDAYLTRSSELIDIDETTPSRRHHNRYVISPMPPSIPPLNAI